jgi:vacuolar-type H+-ATPase subunit I/STV1
MEKKDKIAIYSTDQYHQALIVQEMLAEHQIESDIVNRQDSSFHIGDVEVYVSAKDEERAKNLVQKL